MPSDYQRIEQAIHFLNDHAGEQPELQDLAQHVGLSPSHLQRLFRRWAGISPKRFLQIVTARRAEALLATSHSVLDTAHACGLSGPGRLHDLTVAIHAVTPGELKSAGSGLTIAYGIHPSPFGDALFAATERGLCGLWFLNRDDPAPALNALARQWPRATFLRDISRTKPIAEAVFPTHGRARAPTISLWVKGTNFQTRVWEAMLRIPEGSVCSYQQLAEATGHPQAVRAVGGAVARNSVAYLIPCHRVLRKTGALGGYRWDPVRKQAMLAWESARNELA